MIVVPGSSGAARDVSHTTAQLRRSRCSSNPRMEPAAAAAADDDEAGGNVCD